MARILANAIILPMIASYFQDAKDLLPLLQLNSEIRATAILSLRYNTGDRLGFRASLVDSTFLLNVLQVAHWTSLKILDLRWCKNVDGTLLQPLYRKSRLEVILLSHCINIDAEDVLAVLGLVLASEEQERCTFAPVSILDVWGIKNLINGNPLRGRLPLHREEWSYAGEPNLSRLLKLAHELRLDVCIDFCHSLKINDQTSLHFSRFPYAIKACGQLNEGHDSTAPCEQCVEAHHRYVLGESNPSSTRQAGSLAYPGGVHHHERRHVERSCEECGLDIPLELLGIPSEQVINAHMACVLNLKLSLQRAYTERPLWMDLCERR